MNTWYSLSKVPIFLRSLQVKFNQKVCHWQISIILRHFCRIYTLESAMLQYLQYGLFAGISDVAGALSPTFLQGKEAHRVKQVSSHRQQTHQLLSFHLTFYFIMISLMPSKTGPIKCFRLQLENELINLQRHTVFHNHFKLPPPSIENLTISRSVLLVTVIIFRFDH